MSAAKSIKSKMKVKEKQVITSIKIEKGLHKRLMDQLKKNGHTFHSLVETAAQEYLGEAG